MRTAQDRTREACTWPLDAGSRLEWLAEEAVESAKRRPAPLCGSRILSFPSEWCRAASAAPSLETCAVRAHRRGLGTRWDATGRVLFLYRARRARKKEDPEPDLGHNVPGCVPSHPGHWHLACISGCRGLCSRLPTSRHRSCSWAVSMPLLTPPFSALAASTAGATSARRMPRAALRSPSGLSRACL